MTNLADYHFLRNLGEGSFARVKLAVHNVTNQKVAIKILKDSSISDKQKLMKVKQEAKILESFNHPHIMRVYDLIESLDGTFIVMEYVPGGELYDYLIKKQKLSEAESRKFFQQLIHAVEYCHSHNVVHRDIKPENILLDDQNNIKLGDFGFSSYLKDGCFMKTSCGSLNYAAPEILSGEPYSGPEVDVWSSGVVLFLLVSGYLPFDDSNIFLLTQKIKFAEFSFPRTMSEDCKDLILRILDPDPVSRIKLSEIHHHPWFLVNMQNHLTYVPDCIERRDQMLCLIECKAIKDQGIDEEIFKKCLQFNLYACKCNEEKLKRRLLKQKQDEFCVAYRLMLDNKMKEKRNQLNNTKLDIVPFLNRRNSAEIRFSLEFRKSLSLFDDIEHLGLSFPHSWNYGLRSKMDLNNYMPLFLKACMHLGLTIKKLKNFCYQFKKEEVVFQVKVYKFNDIYVIDFVKISGKSMHYLKICADIYKFICVSKRRSSI